MADKEAILKQEMLKDYPTIRMADIDDEARILAVAWHENATNWIGDKHKLASDLMNYARRKSEQLRKEIEEKDEIINNLNDAISRNESEAKGLIKQLEEKDKQLNYLKERCEAAELLVSSMEDFFKDHTSLYKDFQNWQSLKQKEI